MTGTTATTAPLRYITSVVNPEDLARVPATDWVFVTGYPGPSHPRGQIYLVSVDGKTVIELFPDRIAYQPDPAYGRSSPPDQDSFAAHGVGLRAGDDGVHTVYLVNHGGREAVEIFLLDARPDAPVVTWVGAIELTDGSWGNDVAPHPDGGFLVTDTCTGGADNAEVMLGGGPSGRVLRWSPGDSAMSEVPGGSVSSPNGVEVSADGRWCYIASWVAKGLVKLSLVDPTTPAETVPLTVMPDNLTWTSDHQLLIAGQDSDAGTLYEQFVAHDICAIGFSVIKADPETLALTELVTFASGQGFGTASAALEVGGEIWVGSPRADRIAVFGIPEGG